MGDRKKIATTEQAKEALGTLSGNVTELSKDLLTSAKNLMIVYDENKDGLGYHNASIQKLLEDLATFTADESKTKILIKRLRNHRNLIDWHMNNNNHSVGSGHK